jgi:hypothetical protein
MEWEATLALATGMLVILFPVVYIWFLNISGIYKARKGTKAAKVLKTLLPDLTCSIDADCPPGYVCLEGCCTPQKA